LLPFDAVSDRLYRAVRQASKELGKQVTLDIQGGHFTLDRTILERISAGLEHLVRNSVVHGIESPTQRAQRGKTAQGLISLSIKQQGNELEIVLTDDGEGLPLERIREIAIAKGMLSPQSVPTVQQLSEFIFVPGFSTAQAVTELAGRGVGMDVVRSDILALGGRISLANSVDKGARFTIRIPLTLALNQVLMVVARDIQYAIPSSLVHSVITVKPADLALAYDQGKIVQGDVTYPFSHLCDLLKMTSLAALYSSNASVILIESGSDKVAIHVDSIVGNQESIIKPLSPLMARIPGLSSATLLNNGQLCLIIDPVRLHSAQVSLAAPNNSPSHSVGDGVNIAESRTQSTTESTARAEHKTALLTNATEPNISRSAYVLTPQTLQRDTILPMAKIVSSTARHFNSRTIDKLGDNHSDNHSDNYGDTYGDKTASTRINTVLYPAVLNHKLAMVVDDSLTVRKVTQKLLLREGWEVLLAKDGIDALEQLQTTTPSIMLVDIEMPRMDGFDLTRSVRADDKLKAIPIIMITSRIADKHRNHAVALGVSAYMGKPYRDDELLAEMIKLTAA
jgi:CheY-like chemotaxis protein